MAQPAVGGRRGAAWGRRLRVLAALLIVVGTTAFAAAPIVAAGRMGQALASGDMAKLEEAVDWQSLPPALRQGLALPAQGGSGGGSAGAATFLAGMADEMAQRMATPEGLMALMRQRLPAEPGTSGIALIGAIRLAEGGRLRIALHAPGAEREALTVTLAPRDWLMLRWQVVAFDVPPRLPADEV